MHRRVRPNVLLAHTDARPGIGRRPHSHRAELLLASSLHERALTLLFPILPKDTDAWTQLSYYGEAYGRAVLLERARRGRLEPIPDHVYSSMAAGKSALLKGSPLMMASATGALPKLPALESALDAFAVAVQIHDDLKDWRKDYRSGYYSRALVRSLETMGIEAIEGDERPAEENVGYGLFYGGVAHEELTRALEYCDLSSSIACKVGAKEWGRFVSLYRKQLAELLKGFECLRKEGLEVEGKPPIASTVDASLTRFADRLAREHRLGYPEMQHRMRFAVKDGFSVADEVHTGDVFQRALVGWVMPPLVDQGYGCSRELIEENLARLIDMRRPGERGGWSYFPTLPELPPDADDLAQIIQAFLAAAGENPHRWFDEPISLVLSRARENDGLVETWILDPQVDEDRMERYRWSVATHWGRGVDPEVIANFLYALSIWDAGRFRRDIEAGAEWVARSQDPKGFWKSTWYVGPYYGTYVCMRYLATVRPGDASLNRARAWLLRTQRSDGGWGDSHQSWPLQTALGLLGCLVSSCGGWDAELESAVHRAIKYLCLTQREDGLWSPSPFIQMDVHRARGDAPEYLYYSSATISSVFAAAALLEGRQCLVGSR